MRVEKEEDIEKSVELKQLEGIFPKLFARKGNIQEGCTAPGQGPEY